MVCTDRQLAQSQIEQGFSTRIGVPRALRQFSGQPTVENLVDYINRELYQVVKPMRDKLNEVYLPVKEMAPSANPLHYFFSESVVAADPTVGRLRLNSAIQNTSTVIRVSELNSQQKSAVVWLDIMQGSATAPLGVVTLTDTQDPGRFIRFDLTAMVDNGAYWDLTVSPTESSHTNPFVEGGSISIGFIAGVATAAIVPAPGVPGVRAISAGTQSGSSGTIIFSNSNGVTFGMVGSLTITASVAAAGGGLDQQQIRRLLAFRAGF